MYKGDTKANPEITKRFSCRRYDQHRTKLRQRATINWIQNR